MPSPRRSRRVDTITPTGDPSIDKSLRADPVEHRLYELAHEASRHRSALHRGRRRRRASRCSPGGVSDAGRRIPVIACSRVSRRARVERPPAIVRLGGFPGDRGECARDALRRGRDPGPVGSRASLAEEAHGARRQAHGPGRPCSCSTASPTALSFLTLCPPGGLVLGELTGHRRAAHGVRKATTATAVLSQCGARFPPRRRGRRHELDAVRRGRESKGGPARPRKERDGCASSRRSAHA